MEENKKTLQLSEEDLEGLNLQNEFYIPVDLDNLDGIKLDRKGFDKGLKEYSYLAGGITALINVGISPNEALQYFINERTCEHNMRLQQIVNENNIKVAEINDIKIQGQSL